ncbi:MAG: hypothetical protein FWC78_06570 [Defluviitaleaceae bacterium]|nr:hypothetical protein [Defluviitaleaceae bacterium]
MIKIIRENKIATILLLASFVASVGLAGAFFATEGTSLRLFVLLAVALLWLYLQLRWYIKILSRYAWEMPVAKRVKSTLFRLVGLAFGFIAELFSRLAARVSSLTGRLPRLPGKRRGNRLAHYQDEKIRITFERGRNPFRKMKWKNMQTNRDRVRFIYASYLQQKIKKGASITPTETPNELSVKLTTPEDAAAALFPLYNKARYSTAEVGKDEIHQILPCAHKRLKL